jgi:hypothetical protein
MTLLSKPKASASCTAVDSLTIRRSIPIPQTGLDSNGPQPMGSHSSGASQKPGYLLRSRSNRARVCCAGCGRRAHGAPRCHPLQSPPSTYLGSGVDNVELEPGVRELRYSFIPDALCPSRTVFMGREFIRGMTTPRRLGVLARNDSRH